MKIFTIGIIFASAIFAESRDFPQACSEVYPRAAQTMLNAQWQPVTSDATGGLLTLKYAGAALIGPVGRMDAIKATYAKYVAGKWIYGVRIVSWSQASITFAKSENGCSVSMNAQPLVWNGKWLVVPSNGTGEREFLDLIAGAGSR